MKRKVLLLAAVLSVGLATGCVERRYVITSDPPGAIVYRNGEIIGATPVDDHFIYYGKYHFTLVKDGYEPLQVDQPIPAPWYEYPLVDFFSENIYPGKVEDVRTFHYQLVPLQAVQTDQLLQQAQQLRERGRTLPQSETLPQR